MPTLIKHFVTFRSPGTLFDETTTQPIDSWDIREAFERSRSIVERYDARPYCFEFSTRERGDADLDSKTTKTSGRYFLDGRVESFDEVMARLDPKEDILRQNMAVNRIKAVVVTCTPWKHAAELNADDIVLNANGEPIRLPELREVTDADYEAWNERGRP